MVGQVAGDDIYRRRQQAFPLNLKMTNGRSLASARCVALGSLNILGKMAHFTVVRCMFFYLRHPNGVIIGRRRQGLSRDYMNCDQYDLNCFDQQNRPQRTQRRAG